MDKEEIVNKSRPLLALSKSSLSLVEFKLLDCYLSKIDMHRPDTNKVTLSKGEVEAALGVKRIHPQELLHRLKNLGSPIDVPLGGHDHKLYWLFKSADCRLDNTGHWIVTMNANEEAMEYFFNLEKLGYLRYKLRNIAELTSRYSYFLFLYLEDNRFRQSWIVSIDQLKQEIDCCDDYYKQYKYFNSKVLQKCWKEINSKTECQYNYTPIKDKHTHKYTSIKFTVSPLNTNLEENQPLKIDANVEIMNNEISLYRSATDMQFTDEELQKIAEAVESVDIDKLPQAESSLVVRRMMCISDKYKMMESQENTVKSPLAYLCASIRNADYSPEKQTELIMTPEVKIQDFASDSGIRNISPELADYDDITIGIYTSREIEMIAAIIGKIPSDKLPPAETEHQQRIRYLQSYFDIMCPPTIDELLIRLMDTLLSPISDRFSAEQIAKIRHCQRRTILESIQKELENKKIQESQIL